MKTSLLAKPLAASLSNQPFKSVRHSVFAAAVILFIFINLGCCFMKKVYERNRGGFKSCDYIISKFKSKKSPPNVVLLGSSLMRMPFYLSDLKYVKNHPQYEYYSWSRTLHNLLHAKGFPNATVFNLSIDGAMASDICLINRKLLQGTKIPEWIIYGVGPRDFVDNLFTQETRTAVFERLFTINDLWSAQDGFSMTLSEKLDMLIEKFCYLYDQKEDVQLILMHFCSRLITPVLPTGTKQSNNYVVTADGLKLCSDSSDTWQKSIEEYRKRYRNCSYIQFNKQKEYFQDFCRESQQKGINVLLVNMPITKDNLDLIPAPAFVEYQKMIAESGQCPGISLLDLQRSEKFPKRFFRDTVHLNENGGDELCKLLSDALISAKVKVSYLK